MNVLLMGSRDETRALLEKLRAVPGVAVVAVSDPYVHRGDDRWVRVYLTAQLQPESDTEVEVDRCEP